MGAHLPKIVERYQVARISLAALDEFRDNLLQRFSNASRALMSRVLVSDLRSLSQVALYQLSVAAASGLLSVGGCRPTRKDGSRDGAFGQPGMQHALPSELDSQGICHKTRVLPRPCLLTQRTDASRAVDGLPERGSLLSLGDEEST